MNIRIHFGLDWWHEECEECGGNEMKKSRRRYCEDEVVAWAL
jgi:hypothetical protein